MAAYLLWETTLSVYNHLTNVLLQHVTSRGRTATSWKTAFKYFKL